MALVFVGNVTPVAVAVSVVPTAKLILIVASDHLA